jgi:hypothetical protein
LTAENRKLREHRDIPVESAVLQGRLENANEKISMLQRKYNDAFEKNLVLESQIKDLLDDNISEEYIQIDHPKHGRNLTYSLPSSETFIGMRKELETFKAKGRDSERSIKEQVIELAKTRRELLEARRDRKSNSRLIPDSANME